MDGSGMGSDRTVDRLLTGCSIGVDRLFSCGPGSDRDGMRDPIGTGYIIIAVVLVLFIT